jgi:hypothetical protein
MITSYDELPPHFKELYKTLPPRLAIQLACNVGQSSRATLYEKIGNGRVAALKDGGKTLVDTLSLLLDMANLPRADIAPAKRKSAAMADNAATEPRRERNQAPSEARRGGLASKAAESGRTTNKPPGKPGRRRDEATAGA